MSFKNMVGRGRNGRFDIDETNIAQTAGGHTTWIEVFSRRKGQRAPLMLVGNTGDVLAWAKNVVKGIEHGIKELGSDEVRRQVPIKEPVDLTREDWAEIYYALDTKMAWVLQHCRGMERSKWLAHLKEIMTKIGGDGDKAVENGVNPA